MRYRSLSVITSMLLCWSIRQVAMNASVLRVSWWAGPVACRYTPRDAGLTPCVLGTIFAQAAQSNGLPDASQGDIDAKLTQIAGAIRSVLSHEEGRPRIRTEDLLHIVARLEDPLS